MGWGLNVSQPHYCPFSRYVSDNWVVHRLTAQLIRQRNYWSEAPLQDGGLVHGPGRSQYVSLLWSDLWSIAPWIEEKLTSLIDGPGLGN
jgi:hypothetical protein